jgi:hypothetical protein
MGLVLTVMAVAGMKVFCGSPKPFIGSEIRKIEESAPRQNFEATSQWKSDSKTGTSVAEIGEVCQRVEIEVALW